jgi:hypothetical protein
VAVTEASAYGQVSAVLRPAVAEAARRVGVGAVGLVDVGRGDRPWAALNLELDRAGARVPVRVVGERPLPATPLPEVVARVGPLADPLATLPDAVRRVPDGALPVVLTTWALSRLAPARRVRFVEVLAGLGRPCAWVSVEGVGVAPGIPTLGDRPASGHSLVGVALLDGTGAGAPVEADVVARCWSRGRVLAWLAPPPT